MKECTYLIPTYNRPAYLRRHLAYLRGAGWRGPIVIADSSPLPAQEGHCRLVEEFRGKLELRYIAVDATTPFYSKLGLALREIQTPYVALCADDDFLIPASVLEAVSYLARHSDYVLACGRAVTVRVDPQHIELTLYPQQSLEEAAPELRLQHLLGSFASTLWSVYRTNILRDAVEDAVAHISQSVQGGFAYRFPELYLACRTALSGKVAMIPRLLSVRQNPGIHDLYRDRIHGWQEIFQHQEFPARYGAFKSALAKNFSSATGIAERHAVEQVERAFDHYRRNIEKPGSPSLAQKIRGVFATQWFKLLQNPRTVAQALRLETRAPLRIFRRVLSRDFRLLQPVIESIRQNPHGTKETQ